MKISTKGKSKSAEYYAKNPEAKKKKLEYDTRYHKTKKRKKYRAGLNKKRRVAGRYGNGDGKDYDHATGTFVDMRTNRGRNSKNKKSTAGDRRARG
jgi:hypothetical protein